MKDKRITVTGGKLTTFRLIALDVLAALRHCIPEMPEPDHHMPVLNQVNHQIPGCKDVTDTCRKRLLGRLGSDAQGMVEAALPGEMENIPGTNYLWAEIRWAARAEGVCHLDDLLLRRTRLGLILPHAADAIMPVVQNICTSELRWSENQWQQELIEYYSTWANCYSLPPIEAIPDWKEKLVEAKNNQKYTLPQRRKKMVRRSSLIVIIILISSALVALLWKRSRRSK
jgi:glycerol-3-phosphate dehydrogenase